MTATSVLRALAGLALGVGFVVAAEGRTWTNFEGKQIEADYVRLDGLNVVLKMQGREVSVPLEKLSDADKQFVFQQQLGGAAGPAAESPFTPVGDSDEPGSSDPGKKATASETTTPRKTNKSDNADGVARMRSWKDNKGKTIRAKYVRIHGENVVLMQGSKTVSCAIADLSTEDQEFLRQFLTARGEGNLMPSPDQLAAGARSGDGEGGAAAAGGYNPAGVVPGFAPPGMAATPSYTPPPYTVDGGGGVASAIPPGMTDPAIAAQSAADAPYDASGSPITSPSSGYTGYASSNNASTAPYTASSSPYGGSSSPYAGSSSPYAGSSSPSYGSGAAPNTSPYSGGYTGMTQPASTPNMSSGYPGATDVASSMPSPTPYMPESSMPSTPFPMGPDIQTQIGDSGVVYYCSSCGKEVPEHINDKCPHCGIRFDYVEEPDGSRRYNSSYYVGSGVGILVAIIGVIIRVVIMAQRR